MRSTRRSATGSAGASSFSLLILILACILPGALSPDLMADGGPYRIVREVEIGEDPSFSLAPYSRNPIVTTTETGFCAAWRDERQITLSQTRAAIMAARISPDGSVLDPMGVLLGHGYEPVAAFATPGGCTVIWRGFGGLEGRLLPGDPEAQPSASFPVSASGVVLRTDYDRMLLWRSLPNSILELNGRGDLVHSLDLSALHESLAVIDVIDVGSKRVMLASTQSASHLRIYELDAQLRATLLGLITERLPVAWNRIGVDATDRGFVTMKRPEGGVIGWIEYSLGGEVLDRGSSKVEHLLTLDESQALPLRFDILGDRFQTADLRGPEPVPIFQGSEGRAFDLQGPRRIFVSRDLEGGTLRLILELDEYDGFGSTLTTTPNPQRLLDSSVLGRHAAIAWTEAVNDEEFRIGWFDIDEMALRWTLNVPSSQWWYQQDPRVAVAIAEDMILVSWIDVVDGEARLMMRRAALNGKWLEEPRVLTTTDAGGITESLWFTARNLIYADGRFRLVFSIATGAPWDSTADRFVATIDRYGRVEISPVLGGERTPAQALEQIGGGYVIVGGEIGYCRITCPGPWLFVTPELDLYDEKFQHLTSLDAGMNSTAELGIDSHGEHLLLALGYTSFLYERTGPGAWSGPQSIGVEGSEVQWHDDRFVVVGMNQPFPDVGRITIDDVVPRSQRKRDSSPSALMPDLFGGWRWFPESLHTSEGRLILFSSVATADPEDGYVGRLHAYELERVEQPGRGRGVRR